jgi:nitrogen PTS system EIIA component
MPLGELLPADHIVVGLRVSSKAQLLQDLARRAAIAALQVRENLGSTGLGKGFALPHARLAALSGFFALFARLARPIDFAAIDDNPVDLVILLLTPADAGSQHLATLAALSRPLREAGFMQRLRQAPDAEAVHALLASAG